MIAPPLLHAACERKAPDFESWRERPFQEGPELLQESYSSDLVANAAVLFGLAVRDL
jgi:hypothetical protein